MQLDFAFLCSFGGYLQDRRSVVIGAGLDSIEASAFPFSVPEMSLMARVLAMPDEPASMHRFRVELTRPTGETDLVGEEQQSEGARERHDAGSPAGCMLKADLCVEYPGPGIYQFRVLLDGEEQKQIALRVSAALPDIEPAPPPDVDEWEEIDQLSPTSRSRYAEMRGVPRARTQSLVATPSGHGYLRASLLGTTSGRTQHFQGGDATRASCRPKNSRPGATLIAWKTTTDRPVDVRRLAGAGYRSNATRASHLPHAADRLSTVYLCLPLSYDNQPPAAPLAEICERLAVEMGRAFSKRCWRCSD
jgi:hypothetical protein